MKIYESATMHIIPDAVGIYMVTFLSLHEVENMRCVSKRWIDLANNPFLWQQLVNLMVLDKQISTYTPLLNRLMKEKTSWRQIYWTLDAEPDFFLTAPKRRVGSVTD